MKVAVIQSVKQCLCSLKMNRKKLEKKEKDRQYPHLKKVFARKKILLKETLTIDNNYIYK